MGNGRRASEAPGAPGARRASQLPGVSNTRRESTRRGSQMPVSCRKERRDAIVEKDLDNLLATALDSEMFSDKALKQVILDEDPSKGNKYTDCGTSRLNVPLDHTPSNKDDFAIQGLKEDSEPISMGRRILQQVVRDFERQQLQLLEERELRARAELSDTKECIVTATNLFEEALKSNMSVRINDVEFNPKNFFTLPIPKTSKLFTNTEQGPTRLNMSGVLLTALAQTKLKTGNNKKCKESNIKCGLVEEEVELALVPTIDKVKERLEQIQSIMGKENTGTSSPTPDCPQFMKQYSLRKLRSSEGNSRGSTRYQTGFTRRGDSVLIKRRGDRQEGEIYIHSLIVND